MTLTAPPHAWRARIGRATGLLVCLAVLGVVCLLSVALGTRNISPGVVWDAHAALRRHRRPVDRA